MEVMKPEVYWIGSRCYRANPCPTSQRQFLSYEDDSNLTSKTTFDSAPKNTKPYMEHDEFEESSPFVEDESADIEAITITKEDNGFKAFCSIPSSLFSHIIGSKGAVKKRIEVETKTRILVPRQNEKGDIVVRGQSEQNVRRGCQRIHQIAANARFKRDATHFTCFPMNSPEVVKNATEFMEKVLKECSTSRGLEQKIFQAPSKLHLTICVLVLLDEKDRQTATELLANMEYEIKEKLQDSVKLRIRLKGLEIMNDDPTQVDVLYAKCEAAEGCGTDELNSLQCVADMVAKTFSDNGLGKETRGEKVKLHCTLINTRYRSDNKSNEESKKEDYDRRRNASSRDSFDARQVLQKFGDFEFGTVDISQVKIATRYTTGNDGFYKCYASVDLYK